MASVTDYVAAWRDRELERVRVWQRKSERERRRVRHGEIMPVRYGNSVMWVSKWKQSI